MMDKLIIRADGLDMGTALIYAMGVVQQGRISDGEKSYCYATVFGQDGSVVAYAKRNKNSDTITIIRDGEK